MRGAGKPGLVFAALLAGGSPALSPDLSGRMAAASTGEDTDETGIIVAGKIHRGGDCSALRP
jgi:hypothetical protein